MTAQRRQTRTSVTGVDVGHGYTMADLDRLARTVVVVNIQWWRGGDRFDQVETAWCGIAEHLCAAEQPPTERELLAAGTRALVEDVKGWRRDHGLRDNTDRVGPRFAAYWYQPPAEPWEERLLERIALEQVLRGVTAPQRAALAALAAHRDYAAAADTLGLKYSTLTARLASARRELRSRWYAPDRPPAVRGTDRLTGAHGRPPATHCSAGHEWTAENTRWGTSRSATHAKVRRCRKCEAQRSRERKAATR